MAYDFGSSMTVVSTEVNLVILSRNIYYVVCNNGQPSYRRSEEAILATYMKCGGKWMLKHPVEQMKMLT